MPPSIDAALSELIGALERTRSLLPKVECTGRLLRDRLLAGGKVLTAGNGGSAADALHLAEELVGRFDKERPSLPAICLSADPTLLTCIGNDYGFERLFSRQIEGLAKPGDILVVFTTSGKSPNLLAAIESARRKGVVTVALLGKDGGPMKGMADYEIIVPSSVTARIQEIHTFILHSWLMWIESDF
jgi:phosphoheptose isomerase